MSKTKNKHSPSSKPYENKNKPKKRVMHSCVDGYTITEERKLKAEIRQLGYKAINENPTLSNGEPVWSFAKKYVISLRKNRQLKADESKRKKDIRMKKE